MQRTTCLQQPATAQPRKRKFHYHGNHHRDRLETDNSASACLTPWSTGIPSFPWQNWSGFPSLVLWPEDDCHGLSALLAHRQSLRSPALLHYHLPPHYNCKNTSNINQAAAVNCWLSSLATKATDCLNEKGGNGVVSERYGQSGVCASVTHHSVQQW